MRIYSFSFTVNKLLPPGTVMAQNGRPLPAAWRGRPLSEVIAEATKAGIALMVSQDIHETLRAQFPPARPEVNTE